MRLQRVLVLIASHAAAALVGAFGAYYLLVQDAVGGMRWLGSLSVLSMQELMVNTLRLTATDSEHEKALRDYLVVLDRMEQANESAQARSSRNFSRISVLARLALLSETKPDPSEATNLWMAAEQACLTAGWSQCSRHQLREVALYLNHGARAAEAK